MNITRITSLGVCTGCGACASCNHITFAQNALGFPAPLVDENCVNCGKCLEQCIFDPDRQDE